MEIMQTLKPFESIWNFVLLLLVSYPILGAFAWFIGVLCYQLIYRHRHKDDIEFKQLTPAEQPFITIMIPAHNEEVMIEHTINYLMNNLNYENMKCWSQMMVRLMRLRLFWNVSRTCTTTYA